jgi:hypothetical protein
MSPLAIISAVVFGVHHASTNDSSGNPAKGFLAYASIATLYVHFMML